MTMPNSTTITVKEDTWEALDGLKGRGESFDDIITELLERHREAVVEAGGTDG